MADRKKFEEMLELLINEDKEGAEALFHEIVVEKSRDIYESLLEDEEVDESDEDLDENDDEDLDESDDEEVDESDDEDLDEGFNLDEFEVEADDDMMGGDPTDDMMSDLGLDDEGDDDMDMDIDGDDDMDMDSDDDADSEILDRMDDIETAIEQLSAEFQQVIDGGDMDMDSDDDMDMDMDSDDDDNDMDMDSDDDDNDNDMDDDDAEKESFYYEADDEDLDESKKDKMKKKKTAGEEMREYVEKIGGAQYQQYGKMGDNGVNNKSAVAGKNDMGGTAQNILRTDTEQGVEANKGKLKGSALSDQSPKDMKTGNVNVPGGKAGVKHMKTQNGGGLDKNSVLKKDSSDKSATSTLNKVSTRAK